MTMFTDRELAALRGMAKMVMLGNSPYWTYRKSGPGPHVMLPHDKPKQSAWRKAARGWLIGSPQETWSVPRADLRFVPDLCPRCLAALAQTGPCRRIQTRHSHADPEVGLGCPSAKGRA